MPSRTSEFKSCVESARLRLAQAGQLGSNAAEHKQRLLQGKEARQSSRSEFARSAANIANEIQWTMGKLEKLALLAKRKTLFDDRPVEISELTYIIKRDIASVNQQIAKLQSISSAGGAAGSGGGGMGGGAGKGKQAEEHNNNVLVILQGKLASTSIGFKDVLEVRTQNMKASKARTDQLGYTSTGPSQSSAPPSVLRSRYSLLPADSVLYQSQSQSLPGQGIQGVGPTSGASSSLPGKYNNSSSMMNGHADYKGKGRMTNNGSLENGQGNDYLALDMGNGGAYGNGDTSMQQMQLQETQQDQYLGQRATAIESIESTISELGQIFTQLATMVAQQGETVQRIDADTSDIANNVTGAQRELLKYYASVSGNRALMLKVFGILVIFFLIFTLVT
ncbi:MAG: cis-Golgi t-SNARE syntaxin [Cyphobasidiales sp. Tagirdzhanova-0007]|nr:MAG: cis-Golgi t-SNARE syntaxin [Cyphobasidiales sp. Tagirdzhanova-0007]